MLLARCPLTFIFSTLAMLDTEPQSFVCLFMCLVIGSDCVWTFHSFSFFFSCAHQCSTSSSSSFGTCRSTLVAVDRKRSPPVTASPDFYLTVLSHNSHNSAVFFFFFCLLPGGSTLCGRPSAAAAVLFTFAELESCTLLLALFFCLSTRHAHLLLLLLPPELRPFCPLPELFFLTRVQHVVMMKRKMSRFG